MQIIKTTKKAILPAKKGKPNPNLISIFAASGKKGSDDNAKKKGDPEDFDEEDLLDEIDNDEGGIFDETKTGDDSEIDDEEELPEEEEPPLNKPVTKGKADKNKSKAKPGAKPGAKPRGRPRKNPETLTKEPKSKPKAAKKLPEPEYVEYYEDDSSSDDSGYDDEKPSNKKVIRDIRRTNKKRSAKKARIKTKLNEIVTLIENAREIKIPRYLVEIIRECNLNILHMDGNQQRQCFLFFSKNSKMDIAVALLLVPKTQDEMSFLKTTILTDKFMDLIFSNIDLDNLGV